MPFVKEIFRFLRSVGDPVVDAAMAEALPTADPDAQRLIVLSLLERRRERALVGLVEHYHHLDPALQQIVLDEMERLDRAVRGAARRTVEQARLNAIEIIRCARGFRFGYLLSELLHRGEPSVTREAAQALLELTEVAFEQPVEADPSGGTPDDERSWRLRWLGTALTEAAASYHQHGRRDALLAAALLVPRGSAELMRPLADRRTDAHRALQGLIRRADHSQIHRTVLCFGGIEALRPAVMDALAHPELRKHIRALLRQSHLLVVPSIRQTVRRLRRTDHLLPGDEGLRSCGVGEWRRVPRWLDPLRAESEARLAVLDRVTARDDRLTRLLGLRALMKEETPEAHQRIAALALDAEPAIARVALRHLERQRWPELRALAARLVHAPDPALRRLAERHLVPVGFDRLWKNWDRLQPGMRLAAARALMKIDPHFHHHLSERLEAEAPADRSRALVMIRQLEQEHAFESELLRRLADPREAIAAAAAEALGAARGSPRVVEALVEVLEPTVSGKLGVSAIGSLRRLGRLDEARARLLTLSMRANEAVSTEARRALHSLDGGDGGDGVGASDPAAGARDGDAAASGTGAADSSSTR